MLHETKRSIPAWAGQPSCQCSGPWRGGVYPRVGGATERFDAWLAQFSGLSPRGRGNPSENINDVTTYRSIPAWAGQPTRPTLRLRPWGVYPRVGGATARPGDDGWVTDGLSPRGRGNLHPGSAQIFLDGLSPRGRGNRYSPPGHFRFFRSIPAWAGQPQGLGLERPANSVYPRVGGATLSSLRSSHSPSGLSPRGRGNRSPMPLAVAFSWSIPAWAGQPTENLRFHIQIAVYPRVGGATGRVPRKGG